MRTIKFLFRQVKLINAYVLKSETRLKLAGKQKKSNPQDLLFEVDWLRFHKLVLVVKTGNFKMYL